MPPSLYRIGTAILFVCFFGLPVASAATSVTHQFSIQFHDLTVPYKEREITGGTLSVLSCGVLKFSNSNNQQDGNIFCQALKKLPSTLTDSTGTINLTANWYSQWVSATNPLDFTVTMNYRFVGPLRGTGPNDNNSTDRSVQIKVSGYHATPNETLVVLSNFLPAPNATPTSSPPGGGGTPSPTGSPSPTASPGPSATIPGGPGTGSGSIPTILPSQPPNTLDNINDLVSKIYSAAISVATVIFVIMFLIGGLQYLTTAGNEEATGKAKKLMVDAIIGMVLVLAAYAIARFIGVELGIFS